MDSTRDHRDRVFAAAQVDRLFETFEIELNPEEILSFVATAADESSLSTTIYKLIDTLNRSVPRVDFGPNHQRTGATHHVFRVGRRQGERFIVLEFFKGYFSKDYPLESLLEVVHVEAVEAGAQLDYVADENTHRFTFLWTPGGKR